MGAGGLSRRGLGRGVGAFARGGAGRGLGAALAGLAGALPPTGASLNSGVTAEGWASARSCASDESTGAGDFSRQAASVITERTTRERRGAERMVRIAVSALRSEGVLLYDPSYPQHPSWFYRASA